MTSHGLPRASAPRLSATVLLLRDDPFEVLMVSRSARGAFASALVFPGGAIEAEDGDPAWAGIVDDFDEFEPEERALRIGAIRETWEETGMLISASAGQKPSGGTDVATRERMPFRDALAASGARLSLGALTHFGHWITPIVETRRFDTHFYLGRSPAGQDAVPDGIETLAAEWMPPAVAVNLARSGDRPIIFPTLVNLARLAESGNSGEAIAAARERPPVTVLPEVTMTTDGQRRITIPTEAGYSVSEWHDIRTLRSGG